MQESEDRLLVVEDDAHLAEPLVAGLREAGFVTEPVSTAADARRSLNLGRPKLVILDLGLPDADGLDLLKELRSKHAGLPIIITTARDEVADRVRGLEEGADDYLIKPYAFEELLARIHIQLRHFERTQLQRHVGPLTIDLQTRSASIGTDLLDLTPREFDLLAFLASLEGEVASRDRIQDRVWNVKSRMTSMDNVIDVHVSRLRKKLRTNLEGPQILVVRGVGIALKEPE